MKKEYNKKEQKSKHISMDERIKIEVGLAIGQSISKYIEYIC